MQGTGSDSGLDITGFGNLDKSVIYIASRVGAKTSIDLDLSKLAGSNSTITARIIGYDKSTSNGLSEMGNQDNKGRIARRVIDKAEYEELRKLAFFDETNRDHISFSQENGKTVYRTYLPQPEDIIALNNNPKTIKDYYFATESDVAAEITTVSSSSLQNSSQLSFNLDPYEIVEITLTHSPIQLKQLVLGKTFMGSTGTDTLIGSEGNDAIWALQGNDTLDGAGGNDTIAGSDGDDVVYGGHGNDSLGGRNGRDIIYGGQGNDIIGAGPDNDFIDSGAGDDVLSGGAGDDTVYGNLGNDTMAGSFGNDTIRGDGGDDFIGGGYGRDIIRAGSGNDTVSGGWHNDTIWGGVMVTMILAVMTTMTSYMVKTETIFCAGISEMILCSEGVAAIPSFSAAMRSLEKA